MTKRHKIKQLIKELQEFDLKKLQEADSEDAVYMDRQRFGRAIKTRVQTITGKQEVPNIDGDYNYTDEAIRLFYIEGLEKELFIDIDGNKLITLLATIATLASAIVAIILAIKA